MKSVCNGWCFPPLVSEHHMAREKTTKKSYCVNYLFCRQVTVFTHKVYQMLGILLTSGSNI